MYLYHMVISEKDSDIYISPHNALNKGLNHNTLTRWYTNGGALFPELTENFRPTNSPEWIDFKIAFGADLKPDEKPYLRFQVHSEKILVFDLDISSDIFAYKEEQYDGFRGVYTAGLPSIEDLIAQYWESMNTLDDYLKNKPYKNPEILIFETVPPTLIEFIE